MWGRLAAKPAEIGPAKALEKEIPMQLQGKIALITGAG